MFELRVLDGLHRGAALPLFGEQWSIGAHPDADLALYDPGIAERHVRLQCVEQRWSVQAEEGVMQDADGLILAQIADLELNAIFSIGNVRLCVTRADQPWPQAPVHQAPMPPEEASASLKLSSISGVQQKRLISLVAVVAVIIMALGMASTGEREAQASLMPAATPKHPLGSPFEVRQQLLKMLNERELINRISIQLVNDQVLLDGDVPQDDLELVSRMLRRFGEQFDTAVPVMSRVRTRDATFPFKILQIVGGPNGHVVLEQGNRLFVGDEVDGLRLVLIDNSKVVFDGQQRYEVRW
ncbi:FHA domain-containing protein [Pseudomonas sp. Bout1]|uniref:FHA domain-containing protein n=1 Tax=Pseudomonas sp. Bout1 TaxID=3048600 RepID=UPI002AB5A370|nr:FHA domain-containing protein [Pseudomonas sp. Bout1]MDY7530908.1 FHA domain-containing protein [Pseudomonas sp. Bout1]MEB0188015.1 FHA domain-containing protein [Pseudomonas sp. Bout1]